MKTAIDIYSRDAATKNQHIATVVSCENSAEIFVKPEFVETLRDDLKAFIKNAIDNGAWVYGCKLTPDGGSARTARAVMHGDANFWDGVRDMINDYGEIGNHLVYAIIDQREVA